MAETAGPEDTKTAVHMGSPGGAAVPPGKRIRPIPGVDRRRERPGESLWKADQMPRQRIHHSRRTYVFPDDFPERLVRFQEESKLPWAEINRRLDTDAETTRRWRDKDVLPSVRHMLALLEQAEDPGPGYLSTD